MSWDVIVQNFEGHPPDPDELMEGAPPKPLGTASAIQKKIDKYLAGVDWADATSGIYQGDGFTIEFTIGSGKPIDHVMLSVRGGGNAVAALTSFARPNQWSLFDLSESEFLDLDDPAASGFAPFQEYRDRAVPKNARSLKGTSADKGSRKSPSKKPTSAKGKRKS